MSASPTSGYSPLTVSLGGSISGGNGQYSYEWVFGDGNTQSGSTTSTYISTSHTYSSYGTYYAELEVWSSGGNQFADQQVTITVSPPPLSV
jgi:PKD repeat protein